MMRETDSLRARRFATRVVQMLRATGFDALWAGGCVRDQLMGRTPKDYDVATNATPDEIQAVFRNRRTLAVGASFGVITVLGPTHAGSVEVATFRNDAAYSDGRHPDQVTFSTARQDAQRRDFTINGLFFDPLADRVIDYVGGCQDLQQRIVRAIGNPHERIGEDKLRMLRAVRFAANLGFHIDRATQAAIEEHANEITLVSGERIADEMRRMLAHARCGTAVELLQQTRLLSAILPELEACLATQGGPRPVDSDFWQQTLQILDRLVAPAFVVSLAAILRAIFLGSPTPEATIHAICRRWRLSNQETGGVQCCLSRERLLRSARQAPWPSLQRVLIAPRIDESLSFAAAVAQAIGGDISSIEYCRQQLARPREELDPAPLLTGDDLQQLGIPAGPVYRTILEAVRDAQLRQAITTREEALSLARSTGQTPPRL